MTSPTAHILKLYRQWAVRRANPPDRLRRTAPPLRNLCYQFVVTSICLPRTLTAVSFAMPPTLCVETLQALVPALLSFDVTTPVRVCGLDCLLTLRLPTSTPFRSAMLRPYILTRCIVTEQIFARTARRCCNYGGVTYDAPIGGRDCFFTCNDQRLQLDHLGLPHG